MQPTAASNLISGFKKCGIFPLDREQVMKQIKCTHDDESEHGEIVSAGSRVILDRLSNI